MNVNVVALLRSEGSADEPFRLPEGVSWAAVERCAALIAARDPLAVTWEVGHLRAARRLVLALDAEGEVRGLACQLATAEGLSVDLGVPPAHRRRGLGRALLAAVSPASEAVTAGCDAAQGRMRRFLRANGFELAGLVFHQRWDGVPADVPPAFASCTREAAGAECLPLLRAATAGTWPPPPLDEGGLDGAEITQARRDGAPVGALVVRRRRDALDVVALGVLPEARRLGVGRALLTAAMARAAREGLGLCLQVGQPDEEALAFTRALGFWTYRTWARFRRPASPEGAAGAQGTSEIVSV